MYFSSPDVALNPFNENTPRRRRQILRVQAALDTPQSRKRMRLVRMMRFRHEEQLESIRNGSPMAPGSPARTPRRAIRFMQPLYTETFSTNGMGFFK